MGNTILEMALRSLLEAGFAADLAYPGQKIAVISDTVAAVHIQKVDTASQTVTVEVIILSPAALGGTACESAALRATKALRASTAVCVQNGCVYDSVSQHYAVSILATYTGFAEENDFEAGPGFRVFLNGSYCPRVTAFLDEKVQKQTLEYATRSSEGVAITPGSCHWNITLEERFPAGFAEISAADGAFSLKVQREGKAEVFSPCRWTSVTRSFGPEGLKRISKGIALSRKEESA